MYIKFPSTPYIEFNKKNTRKDKVLSIVEVEKILSEEIYIEEKIDGANLGISFSDDGKIMLQNRGSYLYAPFAGQWKSVSYWIKKYEDKLFDILINEYILFGEWCCVTHSVYYDYLPDWFVGFDVYDKNNDRFLSVEKRNLIMKKIGISPVPMLGKGVFTLEQLKKFIGKSKFGSNICEGIYLRQDEDEQLKYRAKIVREDFQQKIDVHWSKKEMRYNKVKSSALC